MKNNFLTMVLCCLVALAALSVLWAFGVSLAGNLLLVAILIICPLMHLLLMRRSGPTRQKNLPK